MNTTKRLNMLNGLDYCYLTRLGLRHNAVTGILFILGTGVMLILAGFAGLSMLFAFADF